MYIIKLGGSVITDKSHPCCFKPDVVSRLADEIKKANQQIILIHGAGSFGHILAKEYDLNQGYKNKKQLHGFALTHGQVQHLNTLVLDIFHKHELAAVSIPPHAMITLDNHLPKHVDLSFFTMYLNKGFTPITFGDVVLDDALGFSICSGDLLTQILAAHFKPEKVIFVLDEDGLFTTNPKIDSSAKFIEEATSTELEQLSTTANTHADVTKGMAGKLETIKTIAHGGVDTILLNGNADMRLYNILTGKSTRSTLIHGEQS